MTEHIEKAAGSSGTKIDTTLRIEPELEQLLPPLSEAELNGLEADILQRGVLSPLVVWNDVLVDGHNRYNICTKHSLEYPLRSLEFESLEAAKLWAWRHQENRRNLTPYQRVEISLKFKPQIAAEAKERQLSTLKQSTDVQTLAPRREHGKTRDEVAVIAKVSHGTPEKGEFIANNADEKTKQKLRSGETTINAEFKRLKKEVGKQERNRKKEAEIVIPADERIRLFTASISEAAGQIEAESVDFIVTDPPYPKEFLHVYGDLAVFAKHVLKPGGSLLCMVGQSYLPEIIATLTSSLQYRWTLAYLTPGGQATQL